MHRQPADPRVSCLPHVARATQLVLADVADVPALVAGNDAFAPRLYAASRQNKGLVSVDANLPFSPSAIACERGGESGTLSGRRG